MQYYTVKEHGRTWAAMELPVRFLTKVSKRLAVLVRGYGQTPLPELLELVGMVGRLAYIVPEARPFVQALWTAYTEAARAYSAGENECKPFHGTNCRFAIAARWLMQLIQYNPQSDMPSLSPVRTLVPASDFPDPTWEGTVFQFDASPWGAGAVLKRNNAILEYWHCTWNLQSVAHLGVATGQAKFQIFWEFLALLLCLIIWSKHAERNPVLLVGDSKTALQDAIDFKGKRSMLAVARELAWHTARKGWTSKVGHLASEHNVVPDALSRLEAPKPKPFPSFALAKAARVQVPPVASVWKINHSLAKA